MNIPSDINEHILSLSQYAMQCKHIVECGVREVVSSYAFAFGIQKTDDHKLILIDPYKSANIDSFLKLCKDENINAEFIHESDILCSPIDTDLLFIDTWHVYGQLKRELAHWHSSVKKYIIMHDTTIDAIHGETIRMGGNPEQQAIESGFPIEEITKGLCRAIEEFLQDHPEWKLERRYENNNGLTILVRVVDI